MNCHQTVQSHNPWQSVIQTNYDIIKAHGGELKVESEVGEGSTFSILLPLKMENV